MSAGMFDKYESQPIELIRRDAAGAETRVQARIIGKRKPSRKSGRVPYPAWICHDCGDAHGKVFGGHLATYHRPDTTDPRDRCGWCGTQAQPLTEPRDYGFPRAPGAKVVW